MNFSETFEKDTSFKTGDISILAWFQWGSKQTNRPTDRQENHHKSGLPYESHRMPPKNLEKLTK